MVNTITIINSGLPIFPMHYSSIYKGACGLVTTLPTAMATDPAATANNTYATVSAPLSSVLRPRELFGLLSSPIIIISSSSAKGEGMITESEPVPKEAPTAIRRQNSYVAHKKGMMPMMNTSIFVVVLNCSICKLSCNCSDTPVVGSDAFKRKFVLLIKSYSS